MVQRTSVLAWDRRDQSHVCGHVLRVLALKEPGRHHALAVRVLDPVVDQPLDRGALDPVLSILAERVVEIRARGATGAGMGQRVAGATFGREQLLAPREACSRMLERGGTT